MDTLYRTGFLGDQIVITLPLKNEDGTAFTPGTAYSLIFTAKLEDTDEDSAAILQLASGAGIVHSGSNAICTINPAATLALAPLNLVFDIQAQNVTTGEVIRTPAYGRLQLRRDITRLTTTSIPIFTSSEPVPFTVAIADAVAGLVSLTGGQTIGGYKTFTDPTSFDIASANTLSAGALTAVTSLTIQPGATIMLNGSVPATFRTALGLGTLATQSGTFTSTGIAGTLADASLTIAKTSGLQTALDGVAETNGKTATLARFTQLTAGSFVSRGDSPEIGGPFVIATQNAEQRMTVQTEGGIAGSGTLADNNGQLYYFGNDPGKTCRSYVFEVEYKRITSGTGIAVGVMTFAFHTSPVINASSPYNIPLPAGMLHIQTTEAGITYFDYAHAQGVNFTTIPAVNEVFTGSGNLWNPANPTGSLPRNKKFTIEFQFDGEECRVICMGRTMIFRHAAIAAAAPRYWFFESNGAASNDKASFPVLHSVAIDSDKWRANAEQSQTLREFVMGGPLERNILQGGTSTTSALTIRATSSGSATTGSDLTLYAGNATKVLKGTQAGQQMMGNADPITTAGIPTFQVFGQSSGGTMLLTNSVTANQNKSGILTVPHYSSGISTGGWGAWTVIRGDSTNGNNTINIGGDAFGPDVKASAINFVTGASFTTTSGVNRLSIAATGAITTGTVGQTIGIKSGANALAGTVTLTAGAGTISSAAIDANTAIVLTLKTLSGTIGGQPYVATITPATGCTIAGGGGSNNSTYNWVALKVN